MFYSPFYFYSLSTYLNQATSLLQDASSPLNVSHMGSLTSALFYKTLYNKIYINKPGFMNVIFRFA